MKFRHLILTIFFTSVFFSLSVNGQIRPDRQWPWFRGYMASGVLDNTNLPESFDLRPYFPRIPTHVRIRNTTDIATDHRASRLSGNFRAGGERHC